MILVSTHVTSIYTNISQVEGIFIECTAYKNFYRDALLFPKPPLEKAFERNSFQFNEQNYLQMRGTAMVIKKVVAFANIFMAKIKTQIFDKSANKPLV